MEFVEGFLKLLLATKGLNHLLPILNPSSSNRINSGPLNFNFSISIVYCPHTQHETVLGDKHLI